MAATIPDDADIVVTGVVSEADKWDLVRDALVAVSPSALESFSLVVLEAWEQSVPVMVNATCDPTREHCERSGGGLWFGSFREFEVVLERLCADARPAASSGARGHAYVERYYQWPALIGRYARFLTAVLERGPTWRGTRAARPDVPARDRRLTTRSRRHVARQNPLMPTMGLVERLPPMEP